VVEHVGQVVLVTGVSRHLGGRFAEMIGAHPEVDRVIGVDVVPPRHSIGDADFVRADIRNPVIAKVISGARVDTVVHLNVIATPLSAGGRTSMKEINVIGTMQLLAACQRAASVRRLVVKSSAAVYGSGPSDPAMFTEDTAPRSLPRTGFAKDSVEVEGYVRGFSRRRPDVAVSLLRIANVVGPRIRTGMTDYFSLPVVPTVLGFDGRLQFVHEDDALAALQQAAVSDGAGVVNVAGDGVLTVSQAVRMTGRPMLPVPTPAGGWIGQIVRRSRLADFSPEQIQFLAYGRGMDTTRMRQVLGFEPTYTTRAAFESFVSTRARRQPSPVPALGDLVAHAERWAQAAASRPGRAS
jgi:UDP-glucose 4-epimerase